MKPEIEKAWVDLFNSSAEPRWSLVGQICAAMGAGVIAGLCFGLIFILK
jgi:hypothetical protein